jgi:hypothetical protein
MRTFDQPVLSARSSGLGLTPTTQQFSANFANNGDRFAAKQIIQNSLRYRRDRSTSCNDVRETRKPPLVSDRSQASIIAEMHFQQGMKDIKQDLQKKISSYQSLLKKTYGERI